MTTTTPATPVCLSTPYSAKPNQKGGTLIAEAVESLEAHRALICDPDGYRPERCPRCSCVCVHAHDFRERVLVTEQTVQVETIRRYRCADAGCGAVWRILPAVITRHLHRCWATVQDATIGPSSLPKTTVRRWQSRLALVAIQLIQLLATTSAAEVTDRLSIVCSRAELVDALASGEVLSEPRRVQQLAAWLHRLAPGVRLM